MTQGGLDMSRKRMDCVFSRELWDNWIPIYKNNTEKYNLENSFNEQNFKIVEEKIEKMIIICK